MKRLNYIDRLKGFAILLVVMGHIGLFSMHPADGTVFRVIQSFHMPLFMFLSGIVISTPPRLTKFKNKTLRYLAPMVVFGLLFTLYMQPSLSCGNVMKSIAFLLSEAKNGYWYFWSLTMFYATLCVFRINRSGKTWVEVFMAMCFYALFYIGWRRGGQVGEALSLEHAACFYPFFVMGYWVRKHDLVSWLLRRNWLFTLSIVAYLLLFNINLDNVSHAVGSMAERFMVPLMAIIACIYIFAGREERCSYVENQLAFWGRNTLSIYAIHFFIMYKINLELLATLFADNSNTFTLLVLAVLISIVVVYFSIYIGKFLKISDLVRRYVYAEKS